jgi:signal transduction histidine kinase
MLLLRRSAKMRRFGPKNMFVRFVSGLAVTLIAALPPVASRAADPLPRSVLVLDQSGADSAHRMCIWSFFWTMTWARAALWGLALLAFATVDARAAEPRRVLLLHAFGHPYSPWSDMAGSFHAELIKKAREPIDVYEVSLDTARTRESQDEKPFVEYIRALLAGRKLDLIVPVGAPAAYFAQRYRPLAYATTPMLIVGADKRRIPDATLTANDAAVLLALDLPAYLENILRLRPETTDVAVVVGNSPVERYWTSELRRDFQPLAGRLNITWFNDLTFDEMLTHAAAMPPRSAIFYFLLSEDAAGVTYSQDRALEKFREVATAPIFGMGDYELGRGIVGGPLMQTQALGQQAAEVALRILKGETPSRINPPSVVFGAPMYDWRELRRWGISEDRLPPSSVVHFREPTAWQQYRWQMIAVALVLLFQATLITGLLVERHRRLAAEMESRRRLVELAHMNRTAAVGAMSASIAHELNQPLGAILSNAEAAELLLVANPLDLTPIKEILADIRQADERAGEIIAGLRGLLKRKEVVWREIELREVIANVVHLLEPEAKERNVEMSVDRVQPALFVRADLVHLQQVLLNLALNGMDAMLDAVPGRRRITFETAVVETSTVEVSVADTGAGIPNDKLKDVFEPFYTTKPHGTGLGLSIVRTIIDTYGGRIWAENRLDGGAVFRFSLPLSAKPA